MFSCLGSVQLRLQISALREAFSQRDCQAIPTDDDLTALFFLGKHETHRRGDHGLLGRWKLLEQIASPASATR